jgi:hypothetical protein
MPFGKWKAVVEELREQRESGERAWAEQRAELRDRDEQREREAAARRAERERAEAARRAERERQEAAWQKESRDWRDRNDEMWRAARREHLLARRQMERNEQQFELNRRAYEEGMALCQKLVEKSVKAFDDFAREIHDHRAETRAQTQALLRVIDRMDRLDGGTAAA